MCNFVYNIYEASVQLLLGHIYYCSSPVSMVLSKFAPAVVLDVLLCCSSLLYYVEVSLLYYQAQNWSCSCIQKTRKAADIHRSVFIMY